MRWGFFLFKKEDSPLFIKAMTVFFVISEGQWGRKPFEGGAGTVPRGITQEESEA
jgi:hypothetical protein